MRSLPLYFSAAALALSGAALVVTLLRPSVDAPLILGAGDPLGQQQIRPKVMFPALEDPEGRHTNHAIALAHNWGWRQDDGWKRDDTGQPSVAVVLESWYRGLGELNFDMRPPADYTAWRGGRAMGLAARYDGTFTILSVGGEPYSPGGSGAQIVGGKTSDPIMTLFEAEEGEGPMAALRVQRRDNSASVSLRVGSEPGLAFGLGQRPAEQASEGVLRFAGPTRQPIVGVSGAGPDATLIASRPGDADTQPRLRLSADGRMEWGDGASASDVSLRRAERGRLALEGELVVSSLRVGGGAPVQGLHVLTAEVRSESVPGDDARDITLNVTGLAAASLVFVNGPEQPRGLSLAAARAVGPDRLVLRFANTSTRPLQPAAGTYTILAVEPAAP